MQRMNSTSRDALMCVISLSRPFNLDQWPLMYGCIVSMNAPPCL
jgi:hypothetical protein